MTPRNRPRFRWLRLGVLAGWLLAAAAGAGAQQASPVLDETFQALLDAETSSRRDTGCQATLLIDGPAAFEAIRDLISQATDHLNVETLEFEDNDLGRESASLFAEAALRGLEVNIIVDPVETWWLSTFDILNFIAEAGGNYRAYWATGGGLVETLNLRTHKKILVADGLEAIIGGMNYGSSYFAEGGRRDTDILLTGPVVGSIQEEFIRDWTELGGWPDTTPDLSRYYPELEPTGPGVIRNVDQRPANGDFEINRLFELLIGRAARRVVIQNPYFIPNDRVQRLLTDAAARGVQVIVLTNGRTSGDLGDLIFLPGALRFGPLTEAGVQINLWEPGVERMLHSKTMLVDDLAVVGSYNMDNRSYRWDTENVVVLTEPNQVAAVRDMLIDDLSREWVVPVNAEWFGGVSICDWMRAWFFNLFAWLL